MKKVAIIIFVLIFLIYFVYPVGVGIFATTTFNKEVGLLEGSEEVTLLTEDNVKLKAWYIPSKNNKTIILVHGATTSREELRNHIEFLKENKFGILAFDMRGHGESEGDGVNAYNWDGEKDVLAAINFLEEKGEKNVGALGLSLGAEVILSSAHYEQIKAIVSEGATEHSIKDYLELKENRNIFKSYFTRLMYATASFIGGTKTPTPIAKSILESNAKIIFIGSKSIEKEVTYNTYYHNLIKDKSELWLIDNCKHTKGLETEKENYIKKIISFFEASL